MSANTKPARVSARRTSVLVKGKGGGSSMGGKWQRSQRVQRVKRVRPIAGLLKKSISYSHEVQDGNPCDSWSSADATEAPSSRW